jgi:hypothetical protein
MAGEGEVNPVDPIRRKVQHARGEPRNVERNGDNHHWAFKRAPDGESALRAILEKVRPFSPRENPRAQIRAMFPYLTDTDRPAFYVVISFSSLWSQ